MGTATGLFTPTDGYQRVQPVFRLFAQAHGDAGRQDDRLLAAYYRAPDALSLTLETEDGTEIPTSVVHIADFRDEIDETSCEVEVHVRDSSFFSVRRRAMTLTEQARSVRTREDLIAFLKALRADLEANRASWARSDLGSFLDAMSAWTEDMEGYYANSGEDLARLPPWRVLADILTASRIYE
jgi:hypothetical protein